METDWGLDATITLAIMILIIIAFVAVLLWAYTEISKAVFTSGTTVENPVGANTLQLTQNKKDEETLHRMDKICKMVNR